MKIVADADIPFLRGVLEPFAEVVCRKGAAISAADLADADAMIVRTRTVCDARLLGGAKVRFIASATSGTDHIDREYCRLRGIEVADAPGCNASSVLQYVAAALSHLSLRRGLALSGKTLGVVGVGHVGEKIADYGERLGMGVLRNDPPRQRREGEGKYVSLSRLIEEADIVTLHVPLYREGKDRTFHLLDAGRLAGFRPDQILINTSRGEVVETEALKERLRKGGLSATVLDVWENEPRIDRELLSRVNVATPHIAGYSAEGKASGTAMAVRAVSRFFGLPLDDWYPPGLLSTDRKVIEIDPRGLSREEALQSVVLRTYDISADDRRLREAPDLFERQRAEYPLRREFNAYAVSLVNGCFDMEEQLRSIGFQVRGGGG